MFPIFPFVLGNSCGEQNKILFVESFSQYKISILIFFSANSKNLVALFSANEQVFLLVLKRYVRTVLKQK